MKVKRLSYSARAALCHNVLAKKLFLLLDNKKTNLALSADVTHSEDLLNLAEKIGPEMGVLKTHVDILMDFTPSVTQELQRIARKEQFFVFEDRKFADIGHTVKAQYGKGIYHIAEWADIVNAHSLPGPGIIQGLAEVGLKKQRGLLLVAEMSSANNLINQHYTKNTLQMAEQHPDFVMGFIAQKKLSADPQWIYLTPGVQFAEMKDNLGQCYITPEQAILKNQSDIIIVGRGITQAENPLQAAKKYREIAWRAYQNSLNV